MMTDRLNQPLNIHDLVLISHPKTSVLLRCMVVKIMTKTVKVVVLPESELENETAYYCHHYYRPLRMRHPARYNPSGRLLPTQGCDATYEPS